MRSVLEEGTTWRALWLTERALIFVVASRPGDWSLHSDDQEPRELVSWVCPLTEIRSVSLAKLSQIGSGYGNEWRWTTVVSIRFRDDEAVSVPLFGAIPENEFVVNQAATAEKFLAELQKRWPTPAS